LASPGNELRDRVRTAHGDAWQAEGRLREPFGGGVAEVRGARLMASGLPTAKWNNADITSPDADIEAICDWYAARDVPWGVRVPIEFELDLGTPLFEKQCAGLSAAQFRPTPLPSGYTVREAAVHDLNTCLSIERAVFGASESLGRAWLEPAFAASCYGHWLLEHQGKPIGSAATVTTDDRAGPATYLSALALMPVVEDEAVLTALVSSIASSAFDRGSALVHANPDSTQIVHFREVGFEAVPGFLVRVVRGDRSKPQGRRWRSAS
jgi:hypothetical protein